MFSHMIRHFLRSLLFDEQETRRSQEFGVILSSSWLLICSCDSPSCMYFYLHPVFVIKDSSAHRLIVVESDSRESVVVTLRKVTNIHVNISPFTQQHSFAYHCPNVAQTLYAWFSFWWVQTSESWTEGKKGRKTKQGGGVQKPGVSMWIKQAHGDYSVAMRHWGSLRSCLQNEPMTAD